MVYPFGTNKETYLSNTYCWCTILKMLW